MMTKLPAAPFLYPILDAAFGRDLADDARQVIRAGAEILQIRAKNTGKAILFDLLQELTAMAAQHTRIVINDYVDLAIVSNVDGVHLGQTDFPVKDARALLGDKLIGISTHNAAEFAAAACLPVDYIAVGPVFGSFTKPHAGAPLGTRFVSAIRSNSRLPLVCIGGIRRDNLADLIAAGADGIALISELYRGTSIYDTVSGLLEEIQSCKQ